MSEEFFYFLLGTAVSIPVNVFCPFLTDRVRQYQSTRNTLSAATRGDQLDLQLAEARRYAASPQDFNAFLLSRILVLSLVTAAAAIVPGFLYMLSDLITGVTGIPPASGDYETQANAYVAYRQGDSVARFLSAGGSFVGVVGSAFVVQLGVPAWRRLWRVRHLEEFEAFVAKEKAAMKRAEIVGVPGQLTIDDIGPDSLEEERGRTLQGGDL